ncbi:helix-turn-helix transcriptional regulator (plasmid) [Pseudomonas silesiensis]|uniref:helix-turn-helix transcriptional regulator n=1 Tax=Pseudomonas silesiensis TaxID=1853130 RepID=UPI0030CB34A5
MKTKILEQLQKRRLELGLKIQDMVLRSGLSRQQYGKIEAGGNPRLETLDQIAEGLDSVVMVIPKDKVSQVQKLLASGAAPVTPVSADNSDVENPWGSL